MPIVKVGSSRQVVIPKKFHDKLGLVPGDYLEVELEKGKVVFTPKTLIDKQVEEQLAEGLKDIQDGRVYGPFDSAKEITESLRGSGKRKPKKS